MKHCFSSNRCTVRQHIADYWCCTNCSFVGPPCYSNGHRHHETVSSEFVSSLEGNLWSCQSLYIFINLYIYIPKLLPAGLYQDVRDFIAINDIGWDAGLGIVLWNCRQSSNALRIKRTTKFSYLSAKSITQ